MNISRFIDRRGFARCCLVAVVFVYTGIATAASPLEDARQSTEGVSVDYSIVVTGNELLSGVYADGHTIFLTRTLQPLGGIGGVTEHIDLFG